MLYTYTSILRGAGQKSPVLQREIIPKFCFPKGVTVKTVKRTASLSELSELMQDQPHTASSAHSFVFRMMDETGGGTYGICIHSEEQVELPPPTQGLTASVPMGESIETAPICYCLITRCPFVELHFAFLFQVLDYERLLHIQRHGVMTGQGDPDPRLADPAGVIEGALDAYCKAGWDLPPVGEPYRIPLPLPTRPPGGAELQDQRGRPHKDLYVWRWSMLLIAHHLSLRNVLHLLSFVLLERQIVVQSENLGLLSATVFAAVGLIQPLKWECLLVPVLPDSMQQVMEAPVPFLVGLQRSQRRKGSARAGHTSHGVVNLYVDFDQITAPEEAVGRLPQWERLYDHLAPLYEALQAVSEGSPPIAYGVTEEQATLLEELSRVLRDYVSFYTELAFMQERIKASRFAPGTDPVTAQFMEQLMTTQHWVSFRDGCYAAREKHKLM